MVQPNMCENIGPMFVRAGRKVSSFMLELRPNICENLQANYQKYLGSYSTDMRRSLSKADQAVLMSQKACGATRIFMVIRMVNPNNYGILAQLNME
jgi:hypothetical protein